MSFSINKKDLMNVVCMIKTDKEQGSGVIYKAQDDYIYILTCYHVVEDSNHIKIIINKNKIIEIYTDRNNVIKNAKTDSAIIVLSRKEYELLNGIPTYKVIKYMNGKLELLISGFPNVLNINGKLNNIIIDKTRYLSENTIRTDIQLETQYSDGKENCKGFSGGGVFAVHNELAYLVGIISEYFDEFKYFKEIPIDKYNNLLSKNKYPVILTYFEDIVNIDTLMKNSAINLNRIHCYIGTDIELNRKNEVDSIYESKAKMNIITGEPGIGKSVIAKKLIEKLKFEYCLYFRGENIDQSLCSQINSIEHLLANENNHIVTIIDSCERVFETNNNIAFIELITKLGKHDNIKFFICIRNYSLKALERSLQIECKLDKHQYEELNISEISEDDFKTIQEKYPKIKSLSDNTIALLKNPFYLNEIICENQLGNISNIENEFQIKDFIWDTMTGESLSRKTLLIGLAEQKLNKSQEYVQIDISDDEAKYLIEKNIIKENNLAFTFCHDKYEDIATKKMLDAMYIDRDIVKLLKGIKNELSYGRAFKLWIRDRLSNQELVEINKEIELLYNDKTISYLWKWNVIEAIYETNQFYHYLLLNIDNVSNNINFIKKIYEISISCDLYDIFKGKISEADLMLYFNKYVIPSSKNFTILHFFNDNRGCINSKNAYYIVKIIEETIKLVRIYWGDIQKYCNFVFELIDYIIQTFGGKYYWEIDKISIPLQRCFVWYASFSKKISVEYLSHIIANEKLSYFEEKLTESIIAKNISSLVVIPDQFIKEFYNEIVEIFLVHTKFCRNEREIFSYNHSKEELYGLNDNLRHDAPYSNQTIIYDLFRIDFYGTLDFVIGFINSIAKTYFGNRNKNQYNTVAELNFIYRDTEKNIYGSSDFYKAYRGAGATPNLVKSILMAMENILLEKSEEDLSEILENIITQSNNIMLIALVMSIVVSNYKKYGDIFLEILKNDYIRTYEIERQIDDSRKINFGYIRNWLEKCDREKSDSLEHRKYDFDKVFLALQQLQNYQNKSFEIIDFLNNRYKEINNNSALIFRNFLHNCDIRNFELKEVSEQFCTYGAKETQDEDLKQFVEVSKSFQDLNSEYQKYYIYLMYKQFENPNEIDATLVKSFMSDFLDGKYNSVSNIMGNDIYRYFDLFIIKNSNLFDKKLISKARANCIRYMVSFEQNNYTYDRHFYISLLECVNFIYETADKREVRTIYVFLFDFFLSDNLVDINVDNTNKINLFIENGYKKYPELFDTLLKAFLNIICYDEKTKNIDYRMYEKNETILIDEYYDTRDEWIKKIRTNLLKDQSISLPDEICINPSNLYLMDTILHFTNSKNYIISKNYIFAIAKLLQAKEDRDRMKGNRISVEYSLADYLVREICKGSLDKELLTYIIDNFIDFYNILSIALENITSYVQDGLINEDVGWGFAKSILDKINKYEHKEELYTTVENHFVMDANILNVGQLLQKSLLITSNWINQREPAEIKILNSNKEEYLDYLKKFISNRIGINNLAKLLVNYSAQFNESVIFNFFQEILSHSCDAYYFSETDTMYYIGKLSEKIYYKYDKLTKEEKNQFYELLTCIGCNAPSPFLLYLKRNLEF